MKKFLRSLAFWAMTLAGGLYGANAHAAGLPPAIPAEDPGGGNYKVNLILDASQISSNQPSSTEGADYGLLIDNNTATFWSSNWNDTGRGDLGYHYLQFDFDEPLDETVMFTYTMRQDATNFNTPTEFAILGSTDGNTYEEIRAFTVTDDNLPDALSSTPYTTLLSGTGGMTSLRMEVRNSSGGTFENYHYFALSEVQVQKLQDVSYTVELDASIPLVSNPEYVTVGNLASGSAADLLDGSAATAVTVNGGAAGESYISAFRPAGFTSNVYICWTDASADSKITAVDVYVSDNGKEWTSAGSYTPQAESTTGMQCVLAKLGGKHNNVKFVPAGGNAFSISEFAVYQAIEILDLPLEDLVNSLPLGVDDYDYGTDPGFVGNQQAYENFYNTYSDALIALSSGSASEEEMAELSRKLQRYKAQAEASIVVPEPGKHYYIRSAYAPFAEKMKPIGLYAPRSGNYVGWHIAQKNIGDVWMFEPQPSGNYAIKSAATGTYINHTDVVDQNESPVGLTSNVETAQVLTNITYTGQFNIRAEVAKNVYNCTQHSSGEADEGPLATWTDKSLNGEGAWYIMEVPEEEWKLIEATQNKDRFTAVVNSFVDDYDVGPDPGQYSKELYDIAKAEYDKAKAMLEDGNTYTEEQYAAAYTTLKTAVDNLNNGQLEVETGYYAITDKKWNDAKGENVRTTAAWYAVEGNDYVNTTVWEIGNPDYIWYVEKLPGGNYTIQNVTDGRYVTNTDLIASGAAIKLATSTANVQQVITLDKSKGRVEISNTGASGFIYHNARGIAITEPVYLVAASTHETWYMHRFTEQEKDSIIEAYPQTLRNDTLRELVAEVNSRVNQAYIYDFDLSSPIVSDASQFYSNNKSTEGTYAALIDNNFDTHFITAYNASSETSENAYHYLRVDAGEGKVLPDKFGMHWRTRGSVWNNLYRPTSVVYSVSDDAVTWTEVGRESNPGAGFPVVAEQPEYTSLHAISPGRGYRYFKLTVLATNTGDSYNGYPWFTFSEFNLYPALGINPESPAYDSEIAPALEALEPVLAASQAKLETNDATSEDIKKLRDAYTELLLVWKDTTDLYNVYVEATNYYKGVTPGNEGDMFTFPDEKISAFEDALYAVEAERPFTEINQRKVAELDTLLTNAFADLRRSMYSPDPDTWYMISSADETQNDNAGNAIAGQYTWMGGLSSVDGLGCGGTYEEKIIDSRAAWKFEPAGEQGQYKIICCGSGWPMDKGNIFAVEPLGDGQVALKTVYNGQYYSIVPASLPGVPFMTMTPQLSGPGSWRVEEAPMEFTQHTAFNRGRVAGYVLPYSTFEMPGGVDGEAVGTYEICGYQTSEDGSEVTAINLAEYSKETIEAGTPFVMVIEPGEKYDEEVEVMVDLKADIFGPVTQELKPANGMFGTFTLLSLPEGMIYLTEDSAVVEPEGFGLSPQRAYIDVNKIEQVPDVEVAYVVYVSGKAGLNVGIHDVVLDASKPVNVYTIDGVLLRKDVMPTEATKGLAKGIYIVGKEKVLVR